VKLSQSGISSTANIGTAGQETSLMLVVSALLSVRYGGGIENR